MCNQSDADARLPQPFHEDPNDYTLDALWREADAFLGRFSEADFDEIVAPLNKLERAALTQAICSGIETRMIRAFMRKHFGKHGTPQRNNT